MPSILSRTTRRWPPIGPRASAQASPHRVAGRGGRFQRCHARRLKEARRVKPERRSALRNVSDAAAHDSGRMMRTMDPFWTSSGASRLDKAAAPRAGGATSALALAASAAKQATLNISTEKVAARLSGPPRAPQISLDQTLNVSQRGSPHANSEPCGPCHGSWSRLSRLHRPEKKKWLISAARTPRALETPKTGTNPALCDGAGTPSRAGVQPGPTRADPAVSGPAPRPRRLS